MLSATVGPSMRLLVPFGSKLLLDKRPDIKKFVLACIQKFQQFGNLPLHPEKRMNPCKCTGICICISLWYCSLYSSIYTCKWLGSLMIFILLLLVYDDEDDNCEDAHHDDDGYEYESVIQWFVRTLLMSISMSLGRYFTPF